jgi:uncharacterized DUF497 family protein
MGHPPNWCAMRAQFCGAIETGRPPISGTYYFVRTLRCALPGTKPKTAATNSNTRLSFETATLVFDDPKAMSLVDRVIEGEERWQTLGLIRGAVVLLIAHAVSEESGEETVRIISARKATPRERRAYEQNQKKGS